MSDLSEFEHGPQSVPVSNEVLLHVCVEGEVRQAFHGPAAGRRREGVVTQPPGRETVRRESLQNHLRERRESVHNHLRDREKGVGTQPPERERQSEGSCYTTT